MTTLSDLAQYADSLLETASTPDYPNALNGVQLENRSPIRGIAAAVDFSMRAIQGAVAHRANVLVVHHGMFWSGLEPLTGPSYKRIQMLMENDIAVYASHLPLDRHPTLGNNVLLAKELGLQPSTSFGRFENVFIGIGGKCDFETAALAERAKEFARKYGGDAHTSMIAKGRKTKAWAMCTGAGASSDTLKEASTMGVDTLIVGEGPHWTAVRAEEQKLAIIYTGHYATETLGIHALAQHLGEKYNLPWHFVSAPTGL